MRGVAIINVRGTNGKLSRRCNKNSLQFHAPYQGKSHHPHYVHLLLLHIDHRPANVESVMTEAPQPTSHERILVDSLRTSCVAIMVRWACKSIFFPSRVGQTGVSRTLTSTVKYRIPEFGRIPCTRSSPNYKISAGQRPGACLECPAWVVVKISFDSVGGRQDGQCPF